MDLDHIALASRDVGPTLATLVGDLGARVMHGGASIGFRAMQVDMGMSIELLEPHQVEANDFLARFLDRHGPGPHHITFKTDDIEREIARLTEAGYPPVNVNIDNEMWREAFIMPAQAEGTVVQVAQSAMNMDEIRDRVEAMGMGVMRWWPEPPEPAPDAVTLRRIVMSTDDPSRARRLFVDLLGGHEDEAGEGWFELAYPNGGRIRFEQRGARGIDRLEVIGSGADREIGGATFRFVDA